CHLHVDIVGGDQPACRDLGRLDLVLERDLQEVDDVELALHLGLEGVVGRQTIEEAPILGVESANEFFCDHEAMPSRSSVGSSAVSVSFVTTRAQRACHGCVSRASACVVKATTGTPARSAASTMRASPKPAVRPRRSSRGPLMFVPTSSALRAMASGTLARRAVSRMRATKKRSLTTARTSGEPPFMS